jgi:hypothetical protein
MASQKKNKKIIDTNPAVAYFAAVRAVKIKLPKFP